MITFLIGHFGRILKDFLNCYRQYVERESVYGHTGNVQSMAFSRDGTWVVSGSEGSTGNIKIWDAETGRVVHTLTGGTTGVETTTFVAGNYGEKIVSWSTSQKIKIWNFQSA